MPRPVRMSNYINVAELCEYLKIDNRRRTRRRLIRRLKAKQVRTEEIFLWHQSEAPNAPIITTLAALKRNVPELFDKRSETLDLVRENMGSLEEKLGDQREINKRLAARLRQCERRLKKLQEMLDRVPK